LCSQINPNTPVNPLLSGNCDFLAENCAAQN
jgi:hypothetical protein